MAKLAEDILTQNVQEIRDDVLKLSNIFFSDNEIIRIGVKSHLKEFLVASEENVLIYKKGFMTGNTFGESVFKLNFESISAIEMKTQAFGAGFIEIVAHGVNNQKPDAWSTNNKVDPSQLENCFSAGRNGRNLLVPVYNTLNDLLQKCRNKTYTENSNTYDKFEELKQYKELLDLNIISQEEFDLKKKELLNLERYIIKHTPLPYFGR